MRARRVPWRVALPMRMKPAFSAFRIRCMASIMVGVSGFTLLPYRVECSAKTNGDGVVLGPQVFIAWVSPQVHENAFDAS